MIAIRQERIRQERLADHDARELLLDRAYGPDRFTKCSQRLREDRLPAAGLSFVATDKGRIVGTVRLWNVSAGPGRAALLLGPLAVDPRISQPGHRRQADAAGDRNRAHARPWRHPAGRRRAVLRPVRLLGRPDRPAVDARFVSDGPAAGARTACRCARWSPRHDRRYWPPGAETRSGCAGRGGFPQGCQKPDTARSLRFARDSSGRVSPRPRARPFPFPQSNRPELRAMTDWPVYGKIDGPIVMIGFGSIGKGTLPLIERHFTYDKERFVVIDPEDKDRMLLDERGIRFIQQAVTRGQLPRTADAAADRGRRPGLLRQPVGRHLLARHHGAVPRSRRALHRHRQRALGRLLFRHQARPGGALELRAAREDARRQAQAPGRLADRGLLLRRQSRHGVVVRQAGAAQHRHRHRRSRSKEPKTREEWGKLAKKLGVKGIHIAERDTQRAKNPKPLRRVRQHLVGRRLRLGRPAAGRARLGHAREVDAARTARKHKTGCQAAIYLLQPGADTRVRSWTPTAQGAIRLPGHPQRVDLDRRLSHVRDGRKA